MDSINYKNHKAAAVVPNDVVLQKPMLLNSDALEAFLCVFCKELLYVPYQSICGDRACNGCLLDLAKKLKDNGLTSTRCPGCGDQISPEQFFPDKAATRELNLLSVSCPNDDCQWEGPYSEYIATHLGVCPQARVKCQFEMCGKHVKRKNLEGHMKKCSFRPERCCYCGRECRANQMDDHYEMCDQFPVKCTEGCGEEIPRESLKTHIIEDCPKINRTCRYSPVGCKFEVCVHIDHIVYGH
jgi:hypothetical protein